MMQQETGDKKEYGYGNSDAEIPTDDEEVNYDTSTRPRINEVPDFPDSNVRDEQTLLNTQRKTGCYQHIPCMGIALDRPVGSALR